MYGLTTIETKTFIVDISFFYYEGIDTNMFCKVKQDRRNSFHYCRDVLFDPENGVAS